MMILDNFNSLFKKLTTAFYPSQLNLQLSHPWTHPKSSDLDRTAAPDPRSPREADRAWRCMPWTRCEAESSGVFCHGFFLFLHVFLKSKPLEKCVFFGIGKKMPFEQKILPPMMLNLSDHPLAKFKKKHHHQGCFTQSRPSPKPS